jgi:hypothetical protein
MSRMPEVRMEIGRRLRDHYEANASLMPERLADLLERIERKELSDTSSNQASARGTLEEQAERARG